jgi:ribosomal 50S subunit-recycling heat shock protein
MQSLKKLWQKPNKDKAVQEEGPVNPYGAFLHEASKSVKLNQQIDVVVHQFEKGVLVTVLQGESRKYSEFFPHDGEVIEFDGEEEEHEEDYDGPINSELDQY